MSTEPGYRVKRDDAIATITFSDAASRNALTRETRLAFVDDVRSLDRDPAVRAIILTGLDPSFSSGVNIKQLFGDPNYVKPDTDPPTALRELSTPTIAAVNGSCYSGGLEIALACSFVIASDRATFADTHAKLGITPGWGLSAELPARVGIGRARQLSLTGIPIDAPTALQWGLVNEMVRHDLLLTRAHELGEAIAAISLDSLTNAVQLYQRIHESRVTTAREIELDVAERWP